ncbi:MAG: type II secretion system secretin GspD [Lysobacteraceae bacterium]
MTPRTRAALITMALALLVALTGCAGRNARPDHLLRPVADQVWRPDAIAAAPAEEIAVPTAEPPGESGHRSVEQGTATFINQDAARQPAPTHGKDGDVTFNFEGDSLNAVVKAILGDYLQQNYVIAPGVQGTVTFSTAKPMRRDQVMSILEMLLRWNNATLVWEDDRYTILPVDQALPGNLIPGVGKPHRLGYQVRAVPLSYISATEMEKLLKPYARPNSVISTDNARSMIVLAGTPAELNNYLQTIRIFDVDWLEGMSVGIFPMQQIEASKVVGELEKVFGVSSDTPMAGLFRFMPLEGINAVLVITPQPKYLKTAEEWLEKLDQGSSGGGQRLYVYEVKNVKAADLADTLSDVFGTGGGGSRSNSGNNAVGPGLQPATIRSSGINRAGGRSSSNSRGNNYAKSSDDEGDAAAGNAKSAGGLRISALSPSVDQPQVQGGGNVQNVATPDAPARLVAANDGGGNVSTGIAIGESEEVRISAVEESNSLLIKATPAQWESIHHVIERLDQIPLQVHIEAQIVQVDLTEGLKYGVQWYFENAVPDNLSTLPDPGGDDDEETASGSSVSKLLGPALGRNIWGDLAGSAGVSGFAWSFLGRNAAAVITALDNVSNVKVLSAPSLVVLNNKTASINVGQQIPVNTTTINPGNSGISGSYSNVQYLQTGITLNVVPRVNPGGLVFMEIQQDDSSAAPAAVEGGNQPINQRTISTEIAVQSGETVLLGGLIKQTDSNAKGGVPGLSRLPVVGGLFGSKNKSMARQELLVLIKPTVIYNQEDARRITEEYRDRFQGLEPLRQVDDTDSP